MKERVLETYFQVVNHHLGKCATDDIITETDCQIAHYVKRPTMSILEFGNEILIKTLKYPHAYDQSVLKGIFIEGLLQSNR